MMAVEGVVQEHFDVRSALVEDEWKLAQSGMEQSSRNAEPDISRK